MTIALVTPYFPDEQTIDSGIANHYLLLAQSLAAKGNRVVVLHVRPGNQTDANDFNQYFLTENIAVHTYKVKSPGLVARCFKRKWAIIDFALKLTSMRVASQAISKIVPQYNVDVIETTSYFSLCYFLNEKKIKAPVAVRVSTTFSQIMNEHYPFKSRVMDLVANMEIGFIKRSRHLLTHAYNHAKELEHLYGVNAKRFEIIPHGVNLPVITQHEPAYTLIKVLYTGRMEYRKGTDVLLAAIPRVLAQNPDVLFELVGNDPGNDYQNGFRAGNTDEVLEKVIFRGKVDNETLAHAYRTCDVFVAPSRYESFGLIFIEAMCYGKPVIGCNVGGVSEIITDQYNGLFAGTGEAQSLADKIILLANNIELREQLGKNARKTVEDKFTGEQLAVNSLAYYNKLIADFT